MQKKVLVVEDDPSILELIKIILEERGYDVEVCMDGRGVEAAVLAVEPSLIILDLWIPGIDGQEVTRNLKSQEATKGVPIVILSAQTDLANTVKRIGADDYLEKPFDIEALSQKVSKYA